VDQKGPRLTAPFSTQVSRVEIDLEKDAFVVVASDGIWEHMTNDQVWSYTSGVTYLYIYKYSYTCS